MLLTQFFFQFFQGRRGASGARRQLQAEKSRTRITFRMPISWMAPFSIWLNEERPIPTAFAASDWVTFCLFLASRIERPMANSTLHLSPVSNTKYFVYFCKYVYYM